MRRGWFITGTDTGVGKTAVSVKLLTALQTQGIRSVGMKPVATGADLRGAQLVSDDAVRLMAASAVAAPYEDINPYAYAPPISPHLAAQQAQRPIRLGLILTAFERLAGLADAVVVEGAGGWLAPLDRWQTIEDMAKALRLPVVLVVGLRLGCINHALLSHCRILASGVPFHGWVANDAEGSLENAPDVAASITQRLGPPLACFGHDPTLPGGFDVARLLAGKEVP